MISGNFGDEDELFFEIELIAANSFALTVSAVSTSDFNQGKTARTPIFSGLGIYIM